ncbi:hypothetical protein [Microbacterium sp. KKR3/1]|nr:hypothetical protein [Microbacterium sp. KKR3/1]
MAAPPLVRRDKVGAAAITFRSVDDLDLAEFRSLLQKARELELPG